jgi:hypothetical protein
MRWTCENIASQLLQTSGGDGDVLGQRQSASMSAKAHANSGLHEEDILQRMRRQAIIKPLFLRLLRR